MNARGLQLIKDAESFRARPYLCPAGYPTIGYGSRYYDDGVRVAMSDMPMAQTEAEKLLLFWVERFEADVKKLVTQKLNENQLSALTSFAYNIGTEKFKKSTLLKRINENPISPGIASEWRKWKFGAVNGKMTILPGLVKRREAEIALYYS